MRYTKKQILEAIRYWENQLKLIDEKYKTNCVLVESAGDIVNELSKTFDKTIIISNIRNFDLNNDNISILYNVLNHKLFNNRLPLKPIKITNVQTSNFNHGYGVYRYKAQITDLKLDIYSYKTSKDFLIDFSKYVKNGKMPFKTKLDPTYNDLFELFKFNNQQTTLAFSMSVICHEMIHLVDALYGDFLIYNALKSIVKLIDNKEYKYNEHSTAMYLNMQKVANDNGINVMPTIDSSLSYDEINAKSSEYLINSINENINDNEHDSSDDELNIDVKYDVDGKITMISFETSV